MRPIPIITALLTVVLLFMLVFQRQALTSFFIGAPPEVAEVEETTDEAAPRSEAVSVVALASNAQEIDSAVLLRGETQALREVTLLAETSGKVTEAAVRQGDAVANGDLLCKLDPGTKAVALSQAKAALAEAQKNLTAAESLSQDGFASETRVLSARAAFESAQAGVQQASRALEDADMRAPFDGLIEGDVAEVGALLQPGAPCASIVQLDPIKLVGYVAEFDVNRVSVGASVGARTATGEEVIGQVTLVGRSADPVTRTFKVEAEVPNPDLTLRAGQTADILIEASGRTAHLLPQSALTLNAEGQLGVRIVGEGDVARFMAVEMVRDSVDGVWIAGLPDAVDVIIIGQDFVKDGAAIDVTYQESGT